MSKFPASVGGSEMKDDSRYPVAEPNPRSETLPDPVRKNVELRHSPATPDSSGNPSGSIKSEDPTHRIEIFRPRLSPLTKRTPNISGYTILEVIGKGGMGVVFKALHLKLTRIVAIKMMLDNYPTSELARWIDEGKIVAALHHPNIVQIHDASEQDGQPFFVLEYLGGGSLKDWLLQKPRDSVEIARFLEQVARGVDAAHQKNILHRDLKPENVLLDDEGIPKVCDFGIAKRFDVLNNAHSDVIIGTPAYMAPEQIERSLLRDVGPWTDVWALGVMLYEALAGRKPFQGASVDDIYRLVRTAEPEPLEQINPAVPKELAALVRKCLRKMEKHRYQTARELADDLRAFIMEQAPTRPGLPKAEIELLPWDELPEDARKTVLRLIETMTRGNFTALDTIANAIAVGIRATPIVQAVLGFVRAASEIKRAADRDDSLQLADALARCFNSLSKHKGLFTSAPEMVRYAVVSLIEVFASLMHPQNFLRLKNAAVTYNAVHAKDEVLQRTIRSVQQLIRIEDVGKNTSK